MDTVLLSKSSNYWESLMPSERQAEIWYGSTAEKDRRIERVVLVIENNRDIAYYTDHAIARLRERIKKGENVTSLDALKTPEFSTIKFMANRRVIDQEGIYPTTSELDSALLRHADYVYESAKSEA